LAPTSFPRKKEIFYKDPEIKIGNGKFGPVDLIIYKDNLYALKRIPKKSIDKPKRIFHLKCEKHLLLLLKQIHYQIKAKKFKGVRSLNYHSEELEGLPEYIFPISGTSKQVVLEKSHTIEPLGYFPPPLNYIVEL